MTPPRLPAPPPQYPFKRVFILTEGSDRPSDRSGPFFSPPPLLMTLKRSVDCPAGVPLAPLFLRPHPLWPPHFSPFFQASWTRPTSLIPLGPFPCFPSVVVAGHVSLPSPLPCAGFFQTLPQQKTPVIEQVSPSSVSPSRYCAFSRRPASPCKRFPTTLFPGNFPLRLILSYLQRSPPLRPLSRSTF